MSRNSWRMTPTSAWSTTRCLNFLPRNPIKPIIRFNYPQKMDIRGRIRWGSASSKHHSFSGTYRCQCMIHALEKFNFCWFRGLTDLHQTSRAQATVGSLGTCGPKPPCNQDYSFIRHRQPDTGVTVNSIPMFRLRSAAFGLHLQRIRSWFRCSWITDAARISKHSIRFDLDRVTRSSAVVMEWISENWWGSGGTSPENVSKRSAGSVERGYEHVVSTLQVPLLVLVEHLCGVDSKSFWRIDNVIEEIIHVTRNRLGPTLKEKETQELVNCKCEELDISARWLKFQTWRLLSALEGYPSVGLYMSVGALQR